MKNKTLLSPDFGLFLIRVMLGTVFLYHGAQKLFGMFDGPGLEGFAGYLEQIGIPNSMVAAAAAALAEFVGGLALVSGIFMRPIILTTFVTMAVAVLKVHNTTFSGDDGMEYPLTLAVVTLGLFFTGAGSFKVTIPTRMDS